jgi:F0F1-type ATP synthase membrane subunit b/b'
MAKDDIKKLLDEAKRSLESEYEDQKNTIKTELQTFKTKTLDKIQKTIP